MKKRIKVNSTKLCEKLILEKVLNPADIDDAKIIKRRLTNLSRIRELAQAAVQKATADNNPELADKLKAKVAELAALEATAYADTLSSADSDAANNPKSGGEEENENKTEESDNDGSSDTENTDNGKNGKDNDEEDKQDASEEDDNEEGKGAKSEQELDSDSDGGSDESKQDSEDSMNSVDTKDEEDSSKSSDDSESSNSEESDDDEETDDSSEEDDNEDSSNSSQQSTGKLIKNPFADADSLPSIYDLAALGQSGEAEDMSIADMISYLNSLPKDARDGVKDCLAQLLKDRGVMTEDLDPTDLQVTAKSLRELSDEEFGDIINKTQDLIDQVTPIHYSKDLEDRKTKIQQLGSNKNLDRRILDKENQKGADTAEKQRIEKAKIIAREREAAKYRTKSKTIRQFEIDLYDTVREQVRINKKEIQSYDEINNEYETENAIVKADVLYNLPEPDVPIINFYYDVSGSWQNDRKAVEIGKNIAATLSEFEDAGSIKLNVIYFSNILSPSREVAEAYGGTYAWSQILDDIQASDATNVILMTDDDMQSQAKQLGKTVTVPGCVWFIWRNDYRSEEIEKHLRGEAYTDNYSFTSY